MRLYTDTFARVCPIHNIPTQKRYDTPSYGYSFEQQKPILIPVWYYACPACEFLLSEKLKLEQQVKRKKKSFLSFFH